MNYFALFLLFLLIMEGDERLLALDQLHGFFSADLLLALLQPTGLVLSDLDVFCVAFRVAVRVEALKV